MAIHLCWQLRRLRADDQAGALRLFQSNRDAGLILTAGMVLTHLAG
jgi:4-hydroxybenzoate polyprenyltransferase